MTVAHSEPGWNRFHTMLVVLFGLGWAMDAFEVTLIGNVLGALREHFALGTNAMALILASWFVGVMLGASGFGVLSDRYGRRRVFLVSLVLYGCATLLTAAANNVWMLLALRIVAGIGVGAEYSAINAAVAELLPSRSRGRAAAIVLSFWPIGSLAASLLAWLVLAALPAALAWRVVFALGGAIALSAAWFRRHLPESPRWLASSRETGDALRTLWTRYRPRLVLGGVLDFSEAAGYYGLFAFVPIVVVPALHVTASRLPAFYAVGGVGALLGGLTAAAFLDRLGRAWTVGTLYALTAAGMLGLAAVTALGAPAIMIGFGVVNLLATGAWIAAYPTFSELFPTRLRATGIGLCVSVGRIGAIVTPFAVGYVGTRSMPAALVLLAGFWLLGATAMFAWRVRGGIEARHLSLEQIAPEFS